MPIFDQGYQHWSGQLSGHSWRWLAITRHGIRTGMKSRLLRVVLAAAWTPALAMAATLCGWGLLERKSTIIRQFMQFLWFLNPEMIASPRYYRIDVWTVVYHYFLATELRFAMILILLVGPRLISLDLRFNALPLYFSRPLRRMDYFLGKLGIIVAFLGMVTVAPCVVAYVLGLLFSLDITILRDTSGLLLASVAYGLIIAVSGGTLMLALSALSRNSRYVGLAWVVLWIMSGLVSTALEGIRFQQQRREYNRQVEVDSGDQVSRRQARMELRLEQFESSKTNWRPLVSYVENLSRIGDQLLGTRATWERLSLLQPRSARRQFLANVSGPDYPWYWSAAVLAGLFGLSVCTFNIPVKSLDRAK